MRKQKVLEMESVTKAYGDHVVVNNLSVTLFEGEVFGLWFQRLWKDHSI